MTHLRTKVFDEPFLAVLEYILIPKYINFYGKIPVHPAMDTGCRFIER